MEKLSYWFGTIITIQLHYCFKRMQGNEGGNGNEVKGV